MAERNVREKLQPLPHKIEIRLNELVQLGEFDQVDVAHCRRTYWGTRDDWHKILVDCYERAQARQQQAALNGKPPAAQGSDDKRS